MGRQTLNQPPTLDTPHRHTHAEKSERLGHLRPQRIGGVHPEVFRVVGAVHLFFIAELVDWLGFRTVGQTPQCSWKRECDIAGIFALAE